MEYVIKLEIKDIVDLLNVSTLFTVIMNNNPGQEFIQKIKYEFDCFIRKIFSGISKEDILKELRGTILDKEYYRKLSEMVEIIYFERGH